MLTQIVVKLSVPMFLAVTLAYVIHDVFSSIQLPSLTTLATLGVG